MIIEYFKGLDEELEKLEKDAFPEVCEKDLAFIVHPSLYKTIYEELVALGSEKSTGLGFLSKNKVTIGYRGYEIVQDKLIAKGDIYFMDRARFIMNKSMFKIE